MSKAITRKYHLFDLRGKILGRTATEIALILRGKNKSDFTPNVDGGDFVVVVNSDKIAVTGKKMKDKTYHHFSGYPGGITSVKLWEQMRKDSRKVVSAAVFNMLSKNKLRKNMMKRLKIYRDEKHSHKIDIVH